MRSIGIGFGYLYHFGYSKAHWNHEHPVNIRERDNYYIQLLYYPSGFKKGDGSLRYIPGSHKVSPKEANEWVNAGPGLEPGQHSNPTEPGFESVDPELPPGSMVFIDARMYHAVYDKPEETTTTRTYLNFIFKQEGPPHRFTQPIPDTYPMDDPVHKMMFDRPAWTPEVWEEEGGAAKL